VNCFPGDQPVLSYMPKSVIRGEYRGELVVIESVYGLKFRATPNHPILTDRGWVAAGNLVKGSHIICMGDSQVGSGAKSDEQNVPTTFEEFYDFAVNARDVVRVGARDVDLYGERMQGKVDIVAVESKLRNERHSELIQHLPEFGLTLAYITDTVLSGSGYEPALGIGALASSRGSVSGSRKSFSPSITCNRISSVGCGNLGVVGEVGRDGLGLSLSGSHVRGPEHSGLTIPANSNSCFGEALADHAFVATALPRDCLSGHSSLIHSDEVLSSNIIPYSGHVYTLQTGLGWYCIGNARKYAIAKNCNCEVDYVMVALTPKAHVLTPVPKRGKEKR
jgi:hypothetical protein